jgi:hypothetical protein
MPEIVAMVDQLTTRNKYKIIGEALGINASLVQRYSLAELKRRREETDAVLAANPRATITGPPESGLRTADAADGGGDAAVRPHDGPGGAV